VLADHRDSAAQREMFVRPTGNRRLESGAPKRNSIGRGDDPADMLSVSIPKLDTKVHVGDVVETGIRRLAKQSIQALG
jgi:hypothetical protein